MKSAVILIPAALLDHANALGAAMGWGPTSFTIPVTIGEGEVTHYGCRVDVSSVFEFLLGNPPAEILESFGPVLSELIVDLSTDLWGADHLSFVLERLSNE